MPTEQKTKTMKTREYRLIDYVIKGFLILGAIGGLLGLVVFPLLTANGILH